MAQIFKNIDGGKGSGHFEHAGIPKHKGGSVRSGRYKTNQNTNSVGYEEYREVSEQKEIVVNANSIAKRIYNNTDIKDKATVKRYGKAIFEYTGAKYREIKDSYRAKYGKKLQSANYSKNKEEYNEMLNDLDDFIYRSPKYEGSIYRCISVSNEIANNIIKNLKQGKIMDMEGPSSWSAEEGICKRFAKEAEQSESPIINIIFRLKNNKSGTPVGEYSIFPNELEVLSPSTSRYKLSGGIKTEKQEYKNYSLTYLYVDIEEV